MKAERERIVALLRAEAEAKAKKADRVRRDDPVGSSVLVVGANALRIVVARIESDEVSG